MANDPFVPFEQFAQNERLSQHTSRTFLDMANEQPAYKAQILPSQMDFGTVSVNGLSAPQVASVINLGYKPLAIGAITVVGDFIVSHDAPEVLNPGESFEITLTFRPLHNGLITGGLYVNTGDALGDEFIDFFGYGTGASSGEGGGADLSSIGVYPSINFGIIGGEGRDESLAIASAIEQIGHGGHLIVRAQTPGDPIYLNGPLQFEKNNFILEFRSPIRCGAKEMIRINGGLLEIQRDGMETTNLALRANSYTDSEGRLVLPLRPGQGVFVMQNDRLVVRGENDALGKAIDKQIVNVLSVIGDDVLCAEEPDQTWLTSYPDSAWPDDITTGTTVSITAFSAMTQDVLPGEHPISVGVLNATIFSPGQLVYVSDVRTEAMMIAEQTPGVVSTLKSACNMEIARIADVDTVNNIITFDRHLERDYPMAWGAGVTVMAPITNSHIIIGELMDWAEPQPNRKNNALAINYGDRCSISGKGLIEGTSGRVGAAGRVAYSYDSHVLGLRARGAYLFGSAEGYGFTLYYSTKCSIKHANVTGCRHNYLVQTSTLWEISHNYSGDDFISGIDVHGANAQKGWIHHNTVTRSNRHSPGVTNGGGIRVGNTSHVLGDHNTVVEDNLISGYLGDLHCALDNSPSSRDSVFLRNKLMDCEIGFRHYKVNTNMANQHSNSVTFDYNELIRVNEPFDIENYADNSYFDSFTCRYNKFKECGPVVVWDIPKVIFKGNDVENMAYYPGQHAFQFRYIEELTMQACSVDGAARGVSVANCGAVKIVRNWLGDTVDGVPITDLGNNDSIIALDNDNGIPPTVIYDGGDFDDPDDFIIDGGDFDDVTGTVYDGGTF